MGGVEPDMPVIAATRRRAELERLTGMAARVRITNPAYPDSGWTGRIIGLMDQPSILIELDNGKRHACPQAFAVAELPAAGRVEGEMTQDEADAWRELREDDDGSGPF